MCSMMQVDVQSARFLEHYSGSITRVLCEDVSPKCSIQHAMAYFSAAHVEACTNHLDFRATLLRQNIMSLLQSSHTSPKTQKRGESLPGQP
mmetsp:Transcript_884/g.5539  ORF Transcript_884/g.5539 Transcript_884/m.5539 type:complete len:91 (+) Transcript_884:189-461(+)